MRNFTLKRKLSDHPLLYSIAKFIYFWVFPLSLWARYSDIRQEKFRKACYAKFEAGEKTLLKSYGKIKVCYEAISPKNYWHLAIGSQYEDKFMHMIFEKCIEEGDIVLDIGAHTGMYSIAFGKVVGPTGQVFAFEPEDKGYKAIKRNAELNSLTNIVPINIAVSDKEGIIDFLYVSTKILIVFLRKLPPPHRLAYRKRYQYRPRQ